MVALWLIVLGRILKYLLPCKKRGLEGILSEGDRKRLVVKD